MCDLLEMFDQVGRPGLPGLRKQQEAPRKLFTTNIDSTSKTQNVNNPRLAPNNSQLPNDKTPHPNPYFLVANP